MGNKHTADGRWIVGNGNSGDDYKGFLHWRECYICLTEDGATEDSVNYLNALKDYALAHYALGEPIMPPSMTVWVVANGKATAVQADDVKVEDGDYTICGINYSDGAWDYSNAGQGQGGGGGAYSEWNEQLKNVAFVTFEGTSERATDVSIVCSDGYAFCTWEASQDAETGDWTYQWGEWINGEDPIPNLENYTETLEWNLGLMLEAAFAVSHNWEVSQNLPSPGIVCRC